MITRTPSTKLLEQAPAVGHEPRGLLGWLLDAVRVFGHQTILALVGRLPVNSGHAQQLLHAGIVPRGSRCRMFEYGPLASPHLHLGESDTETNMFDCLDELLVVLDLLRLSVDIPVETLQL